MNDLWGPLKDPSAAIVVPLPPAVTKDVQRLGSRRMIRADEIERAPFAAPSEFLRFHEAQMIAECARLAHMEGRRFVDWPKITLRQDDISRHGGPLVFGLFVEAEAVKT